MRRRRRPKRPNYNYILPPLPPLPPIPGLGPDVVPSAPDLEECRRQFSDPKEIERVIGKELRRLAGALIGGVVVKAFGGTNEDMVRMVAAGLGCERVVIERSENQIGDGILVCKHGVFECDQCREEQKKEGKA